jgi:uncharacterized protein
MTRIASLFRTLLACLVALLAACPAMATCRGQNQIDLLPAAERAALSAQVDEVPFSRGNLWRATRGNQVLILVGTMHLDDPRQDSLMTRLAPLLDTAASVLVEAGPEEEARLKADLARDPSLMFRMEGPTLPEVLPAETWSRLQDALRARSVPVILGAKMQPAYLAMILGIPPCAIAGMRAGERGLDLRIIERAAERGIPLRALEPHDTLLRIFDDLNSDDQSALLDVSIALADQSEDAFATLLDSYFDENSRMMWELSRQQTLAASGETESQVDAAFDRMEETLISSRNRSWMPVIEAALANGPALAAFGALHLSGEEGVLAQLQQAGFRLERLPVQ